MPVACQEFVFWKGEGGEKEGKERNILNILLGLL